MFYCASCNKVLDDDDGLCERCFGLLPTGRWVTVDDRVLLFRDGYYNGYAGKFVGKFLLESEM